MHHNKTLAQAILVILILLSVNLYATDPTELTTCSYCKKATSTLDFYCTHCGTWWLSPDNIIKNEVTIAADYDKSNYDGQYVYYTVDTSKFAISIDSLVFNIIFRHYFDSRYQHPIVPFSFIPYNYRCSYIDISALYSDITLEHEETGGPGGDINSKGNHNIKGFSLDGIYFLKKLFFGGNILYSKLSGEKPFADEHSNKQIHLNGVIGLYSSKSKVGIRTGFRNIKIKGVVEKSDYQKIRFNPFIEYSPTPQSLIAAGVDYIFEIDTNCYEFYIPVQASYVTLDNWWQFNVLFSYYQTKQVPIDSTEIIISGKMEKMYRNSSVYIKPQYIKTERELLGLFNDQYSITCLNLGATYAFMKRHALLDASVYYGFGTYKIISNPSGDATKYGGNIEIKLLF